MHIPKNMTNFATKIVLVWPPLRKRFIPTFRFFVRKVGLFNKFGNMPKKVTTQGFIDRARKVHGKRYDYSLVEYKRHNEKVKIICPIHGVFEQTPDAHTRGEGCPHCKFVLNTNDFISKAQKIHGDKYDYSKVDYKNPKEKVCIICKKHGEFWQEPRKHLHGHGCLLCGYKSESIKKKQIDNDEFVRRAKLVHGDLYDYSNVDYTSMSDKVIIGCPTHGKFEQCPKHHLKGAGCPTCANPKGEMKVKLVLDKLGATYISQYKIRNESIFCKNTKMFVDFYLPNHNVFIEYNGTQHYYETNFWGGKTQLDIQQERDFALRQYCKEHKIKLVEIPYWKYKDIETILRKELKIK